jgi:hypothetical protein
MVSQELTRNALNQVPGSGKRKEKITAMIMPTGKYNFLNILQLQFHLSNIGVRNISPDL